MNGLKEMAREAGLLDETNGWDVWFPDNLEAFAKLVAAKEREACAKLCDKEIEDWGWDANVVNVGSAIRERGAV